MGHRHRHHHHRHRHLHHLARDQLSRAEKPETSPGPPCLASRSRSTQPVPGWLWLAVTLTLLIQTGFSLDHQQPPLPDQQEPQADEQQAGLSTSTATPPLPPCEQRALDEVPPDPFYDVSDITIGAAKSFADFLAGRKIDGVARDERKFALAREKANELASSVLKQDDGLLLAVGIASPRLPLAVVQFRDQIDASHVNLSESKSFLSTYWRELGAAWNQSNGAQFWGAPFRDCGPLYGRWLWPYSVTVESQGYKIVASAFIAADVDQCNDALESIFGRRHVCDRESTFCLLAELDASKPRGKYTCVCRPGYYIPNESIQGFSSEKNNDGNVGNFSCIPCPSACECDSAGSCSSPDEDFSTETLMKATIGAILGACMLCCLVLALIVFRQRKCKVALHFLQASTVRCLLEPWCRELGFIICYGAIVLKLYRHLVEFRTRKAHRWVVRDLDLLRYLCAMIVAVLCYLAAFTATSLDFLQYSELVWQMDQPQSMAPAEQVASNMCRPMRWDYVTEAGELLILGFGLQLAIASRNANTQFRERQFLVASILIEFLVSSTFYILRFWYLEEFNPSTLFLALFVRSQLTNTVTLGLIFLPKLWYQHKQGAHESTHHGGALGTYAGICMGDPEVGDVTISEMSPEDIRAELKSASTWKLALSAKHRNNRPAVSEVEVTEAEPSRTPEDSVCSVEGPTDTGTGTGEISGISSSK
uniref:G-protein coupled receptors family 3 profile domain-containing protein n=1 Tax=Anopheles atroparvus TaxID=41427 RepID=A0A182J8F8_ANOAO